MGGVEVGGDDKCGFRPVELVQLMNLVSGCLTGWAQRKDQIKEREE